MSDAHVWVTESGRKWAAVSGAGIAPYGANIVSKEVGDEIMKLRVLLERCECVLAVSKGGTQQHEDVRTGLLSDIKSSLMGEER